MKYLRRLIWYFATRLLVITIIVGLMSVVFYYAMNYSNIQIIMKDGMASRARVVMMGEDPGELTKYFQNGFLEKDSVMRAVRQGGSPYEDYNVRGIDHRLSIDFFWLWPWDNAVELTVTESIPRIDGRIKGTRAEAAIAESGPSAVYPPSWQTTTYKATLVRENYQWKIRSLVAN